MALNYAKLFNRRVTPQSRPIPGSTQVASSGGGYSWQVPEYRARYPDARPFHFPQLNLVCRQRPRTVEVMAGYRVQCAGEFIRA